MKIGNKIDNEKKRVMSFYRYLDNLKNKKAQLIGKEIPLMLARFFLLIIIVLVIAGTVASFYSKECDIRKAEAQLLAKQVSECLIKNGVLHELDIEKCNLRIDKKEYYISATLFEEDKTKVAESDVLGNKDFEVYCKLEKKMKYPLECLEQKYLLAGKNMLELLIGIRKFEKNV